MTTTFERKSLLAIRVSQGKRIIETDKQRRQTRFHLAIGTRG
jgi:hypothetical protein